MNEDQQRFDDIERRRALQELRARGEEAAAAKTRADAVYPAFERSEALRRLLRAHRDYEELTDLLVEDRDMARGSLDLAAMARRRLVALRSGPVLVAMDDRMRLGIADLVITATASQLVFENALAAEGRDLSAGAGSEAVRAWLADAVQDLGEC